MPYNAPACRSDDVFRVAELPASEQAGESEIMATESRPLDILIVGGGPTGLYAAFYAGLRGMRTLVLDSMDRLGGQLTAHYPERFIYDVPGFPAVLAKTLAAELSKQALQYQPMIALGEQARRLRDRDGGLLEMETDQGAHLARTILVAAGGGAISPKRPEGHGFDRYEGRGLEYCLGDLGLYRWKRVLVIGGGDAAVDWARLIRPVAGSVALTHRNDRLRADPDNVRRLIASGVQVRLNQELVAVHGEVGVERVTLRDREKGASDTFPVDCILINVGFVSTLGPLGEWGLDMNGDGITVNSRMETNRSGVYAAGDIAAYPGKLKLISSGFAEAATSVNHAKCFIDPASTAEPGHSTWIVPALRKAAQSQRSQGVAE